MRAVEQGFLQQPLSAVFANPANVRVLRELFRNGGENSARMLAERSKLTKPSVLASLTFLETLGFVEALGAARLRLYRIDGKHPLAPALSALFVAENYRFSEIIDGLRRAAVEAGATAAWLYGSVARGEDRPNSDIDIALVASADAGDMDAGRLKERVRESLRSQEDALRFSASVVGFTADHIARLAAEKDPWWTTMCRDAVPLVGPPPDLFVARLLAVPGTV